MYRATGFRHPWRTGHSHRRPFRRQQRACAGRGHIPAEESLCPVLAHDWVNDEYKHLVVKATPKALAATPGQFFHLLCPSPDAGELWFRRPQSVYRDRPAERRLEFLYKCVGRGTHGPRHAQARRDLDMVGPLGLGFTIDPALEEHRGARPRRRSRHHGADLAARRANGRRRDRDPERAQPRVRARRRSLRERRHGDQGARYRRHQRRRECRGDPARADRAAQGRRVLHLRLEPAAAADEARRQGHRIPGQVAMEQIMACGLGPCYVCVRTFEVDGKKEMRRVCIEGPVFDLQEASDGRSCSVKVGARLARESDHAGLGPLLDRVRAGDRPQPARRARHQDRVARLPRRQSAAARAEIEGGMINSIGLPTKGIKYFLEVQLPDYKRFKPPLVGIISRRTIEDFAQMARDVSAPGSTRSSSTSPARRASRAAAISRCTRTHLQGDEALSARRPTSRSGASSRPTPARSSRSAEGGGEGRRRRPHDLEHAPRPEDQHRHASSRRSATVTAASRAPASSRSSCAWSISARRR